MRKQFFVLVVLVIGMVMIVLLATDMGKIKDDDRFVKNNAETPSGSVMGDSAGPDDPGTPAASDSTSAQFAPSNATEAETVDR